MTIRWSYAFIDRLDETAEAFWLAATNTRLSPRRGESGQFATLIPEAPAGAADLAPHLKTQTVATNPGSHLDLSVEGMAAFAERAVGLGALVVGELDDVVVLTSPAGALFCVVEWAGETGRSEPVVVGGSRTRLDQICVDVPPTAFEAELAFWRAVTGWSSGEGLLPEFAWIRQPRELPLRILLQRMREDGPARMHLDFACDDIDAARETHEELGAVHVAAFSHWHLMRDPAGVEYCLTARSPDTGGL